MVQALTVVMRQRRGTDHVSKVNAVAKMGTEAKGQKWKRVVEANVLKMREVAVEGVLAVAR
jgi:hypothetical protein